MGEQHREPMQEWIHALNERDARIEELEGALREIADDLGKAANQFAGLREQTIRGQMPAIERNPEIFEEKEVRARAALAREDEGCAWPKCYCHGGCEHKPRPDKGQDDEPTAHELGGGMHG